MEKTSSLIKKYKNTCLCCDRVSEFTEDGVSACAGCKRFTKQEMALLLHDYHTARQRIGRSSKLGLSDKILVRIFELWLQGHSKYSIVTDINAEFPRYIGKKPKGVKGATEWVDWAKVHMVIEGRYSSTDASTRISEARRKAEDNLKAQGIEIVTRKDKE